jgi:WD40 repeat protein
MTSVLRLFVSSTFADLTAERDAVRDVVVPELRAVCERNDMRLQLVDLRWGVADEVARDQRTMDVCFDEIRRAQQTSPWLNFVVLLGRRYGWRPLPGSIRVDRWALVRPGLAAADLRRFQRWYAVDANARPPVFRLRSYGDDDQADRNRDAWLRDEPRLRRALQAAAADALPPDEWRRLFASATEQEIARGALGREARGPVYCYLVEPAERAGPMPTGATDPAEDAAALADLTRRLRASRRVRIRGDQVLAGGDDEPSAARVARLAATVGADVRTEIERHVRRSGPVDPAVQESARHADVARAHRTAFTGRAAELAAVTAAVLRFEERPVVVTGPSGGGKTALLARVTSELPRLRPGTVVVPTFVGATTTSTDERLLVASLCRQVDRILTAPASQLPADPQGLAAALRQRLRDLAERAPVVLVLDGLDQLRGSARPLSWLPADLPPHVAVLMSTSSEAWFDEQRWRFGSLHHVELAPFGVPDARRLLRRWLRSDGRTLTPPQFAEVIGSFGDTGLPLQLRLAFEQARRWPSFLDGVPRLAVDPLRTARERFETLAADHGPVFLGRALALLDAAREGLAEDELISVLDADPAVRRELRERSPLSPRVDRLPPVLWYRLAGDLRPYLVERAADGGPVLTFLHDIVASAARSLQSRSSRVRRHRELAAYFRRQAAHGFDPRRPRPLVELPHQLAEGRLFDELVATVCDIRFLEAAAGVGRESGGGVHRLLADLEAAERALTRGSGAPAAVPHPAAATVRALTAALGAESGTLARRPQILRQQLVNRLQWTAPALAGAFEHAPPPDRPGWLRRRTPPRDSPALRSTWRGHDRVGSCRLDRDGRIVVAGVPDAWLTCWDRRSGTELSRMTGHAGGVLAFGLTADAQRVVSAGVDGTVRFWDPVSGAVLGVLPIDADETVAGALGGSDGVWLTGHRSGAVRAWRIRDMVPGVGLEGGAAVRTLALGRESHRAVVGRADGSVDLLDVMTAERRAARSGHRGAVRCSLVSADGQIAVTGGEDGDVRWHGPDGTELLVRHDQAGGVFALAASPAGDLLATGGFDGVLRLRDLRTGEQRGAPEDEGLSSINACAIAGSLAVAAHATEGILTVWDVATGDRLAVLRGHALDVTSCALDAAGTSLVSAGLDGTVRVWSLTDVARDGASEYPGHRATATDLALGPGGAVAATASDDGTARRWDLATGAATSVHSDHWAEVLSCAVSVDDRLATTGRDGVLHVYDAGADTPAHGLDVGASGTACTFGRDGDWVAAAGEDGSIRVWFLPAADEPVLLQGHRGVVVKLLAGPAPDVLVSAGRAGTLRCWSVADGRCVSVMAEHTAQVNDCVTACGTVVSAANDARVLVWDLPGGALAHRLADAASDSEADPDCRWLRCAISADGTRIAASGSSGEVRVWDGARPVAELTLPGEGVAARGLALSADGTLLAVGRDDGLVQLRDLRAGRDAGILPLEGRPALVALHPSRPWLVVGDDGGAVTIAHLDRFGVP